MAHPMINGDLSPIWTSWHKLISEETFIYSPTNMYSPDKSVFPKSVNRGSQPHFYAFFEA